MIKVGNEPVVWCVFSQGDSSSVIVVSFDFPNMDGYHSQCLLACNEKNPEILSLVGDSIFKVDALAY